MQRPGRPQQQHQAQHTIDITITNIRNNYLDYRDGC